MVEHSHAWGGSQPVTHRCRGPACLGGGLEAEGHPGVELRANLESISHRCYLFGVAFVWKFAKQNKIAPELPPGRIGIFVAEQPAQAPHLARLEGRAALRSVLVTVPHTSRSCEHFPDGFDFHLCQPRKGNAKRTL